MTVADFSGTQLNVCSGDVAQLHFTSTRDGAYSGQVDTVTNAETAMGRSELR